MSTPYNVHCLISGSDCIPSSASLEAFTCFRGVGRNIEKTGYTILIEDYFCEFTPIYI